MDAGLLVEDELLATSSSAVAEYREPDCDSAAAVVGEDVVRASWLEDWLVAADSVCF